MSVSTATIKFSRQEIETLINTLDELGFSFKIMKSQLSVGTYRFHEDITF